MTTTTANKNLEQKLRRALNKHGYSLHKSRKPFGPNNLGGYMIVDTSGNYVCAGSNFELEPSDVADWIHEWCEE